MRIVSGRARRELLVSNSNNKVGGLAHLKPGLVRPFGSRVFEGPAAKSHPRAFYEAYERISQADVVNTDNHNVCLPPSMFTPPDSPCAECPHRQPRELSTALKASPRIFPHFEHSARPSLPPPVVMIFIIAAPTIAVKSVEGDCSFAAPGSERTTSNDMRTAARDERCLTRR